MTREQQILDILFDRFPLAELGGGPERDLFERLRNHVGSSPDLVQTLHGLHSAERCDDLALSLLWVVDRVGNDQTRTEPHEEEETQFVNALRKCLGLRTDEQWEQPMSFGIPEAQPSIPDSLQFGGLSPEAPAQEVIQEAPQGIPSSTMASGGGLEEGVSDQGIFGRLLEQFLEAVQGGTDDRSPLLMKIRANCAAVQADDAAPDEFKQYALVLEEFLRYVDENQLLDDVRVMNLVTNTQDPFSQWLNAPEDGRAGILDQGIELLREFRTMFE